MGKLDNIINFINQDKRYLISVFDCDLGTYIYKYFPATNILEQFGTAESFFEDLNAKNHKHLNIQSHQKNGSGKKKIAEPITVNFSSTQEEQPVTKPVAIEQQPNFTTPMSRTEANAFGLGATQIFELMVEKNEANRLRTDNAELKSENKRLREQNEEYKEKLLSDKYDYQKEKDKRDSTNGMLTGLMGALPMVMEHLKPAQSVGLASPQVNYGSLVKNNFAQNLENLDDETVKVLSLVIHTMGSNEQFSADFVELLKKHNLWQ